MSDWPDIRADFLLRYREAREVSPQAVIIAPGSAAAAYRGVKNKGKIIEYDTIAGGDNVDKKVTSRSNTVIELGSLSPEEEPDIIDPVMITTYWRNTNRRS